MATYIVNPDDIVTGMWNQVFKVEAQYDLQFYVAADCEQDAIDEIVDYIESEESDLRLEGFVMNENDLAEALEDEIDVSYAGNHGHPLDPGFSESLAFTRVPRSGISRTIIDDMIGERKDLVREIDKLRKQIGITS